MHRSGEKRISCKRCQTRKIKCSRTSPCRNCTAADVKCEFRGDDWKRFPVSHDYVATLESRIATLESFLSSLKAADRQERDFMIDGIDFVDHLPDAPGNATDLTDVDENEICLNGWWSRGAEGSSIYHGPGGVFNTALLRSHSPRRSRRQMSLSSDFIGGVSGLPDNVIGECVALFFRWHSPYCSIVNRDLFLLELSDGHDFGVQCTQPLLHAVCALGGLMSSDTSIRELAESFATSAQDTLTANGFWVPHVTSAQALMLSAYFEAGKGNVSKAWMFSGMAFRMVQDLGLHCDPNRSSFEDYEDTSPKYAQAEFRGRILRNLYLSDKVLSLFCGRPAVMRESEMDIDGNQYESFQFSPSCKATVPMVSYSSWECWLDQQGLSHLRDADTTTLSSSILDKYVELGKIIEDVQSRLLSAVRQSHRGPACWTGVSFNKLNARFWSWHDALPGEMRWNRWGSNSDPVDPSIATLHMLYHTARIALNRPFINKKKCTSEPSSPQSPSEHFSDAYKMCDISVELIISIIRRFKAQHSLKKSPLVFVHAVIAASDVLMACEYDPPRMVKDANLPALDDALAELSHTWTIASDARAGLRNVLKSTQIQRQENPHTPCTKVESSPPPAVLRAIAAVPEPMGSDAVSLGLTPSLQGIGLDLLFQTTPGGSSANMSDMFMNENAWDPSIFNDDGATSSWTSSEVSPCVFDDMGDSSFDIMTVRPIVR